MNDCPSARRSKNFSRSVNSTNASMFGVGEVAVEDLEQTERGLGLRGRHRRRPQERLVVIDGVHARRGGDRLGRDGVEDALELDAAHPLRRLVQHLVELAVHAEHLVQLLRRRVQQPAVGPRRPVERARVVSGHGRPARRARARSETGAFSPPLLRPRAKTTRTPTNSARHRPTILFAARPGSRRVLGLPRRFLVRVPSRPQSRNAQGGGMGRPERRRVRRAEMVAGGPQGPDRAAGESQHRSADRERGMTQFARVAGHLRSE